MKKRTHTLKQFTSAQEAIAHALTLKAQKLDQWSKRYTIEDGVRIFDSYWRAAIRESFPAAPVMQMSKKRDVPQLKRLIVVPLRDAGLSVQDFAGFVVHNWKPIRHSRQFRSFSKYPEYPALAWLFRFADLYVSCFYDYQRLKDGVFEEPERKRENERAAEKQESLIKVVRIAQEEIRKREFEIMKLRAKIRDLQSEKKPAIKRPRKAKPAKNIPEWE
jgi:hypothetical protein